jgi:hypothetical protein
MRLLTDQPFTDMTTHRQTTHQPRQLTDLPEASLACQEPPDVAPDRLD